MSINKTTAWTNALLAYGLETGRSGFTDFATGDIYVSTTTSAGTYYLVEIYWQAGGMPGVKSEQSSLIKTYQVSKETGKVYSASGTEEIDVESSKTTTTETTSGSVLVAWVFAGICAIVVIVAFWRIRK